MLEYEDRRTQDIIERLISIGKIVHTVVVVSFVLQFASIFAAFGNSLGEGASIIMGILGGVIGYKLGGVIASLFIVMLEWCAQILVALENIIILLNKKV